jgi:hypothetical protein
MHRTFWCPWEQKINTCQKKSERRQKVQNALRTNEKRRGCKIKKIHQEVRENKVGKYGMNDTKMVFIHRIYKL